MILSHLQYFQRQIHIRRIEIMEFDDRHITLGLLRAGGENNQPPTDLLFGFVDRLGDLVEGYLIRNGTCRYRAATDDVAGEILQKHDIPSAQKH